jgi:circadian clock protein KaiC
VVLLDHKVIEKISTRRLRIIKYRGSAHGTNEYPFLIDAQGICVMPITSIGLNAKVEVNRIPTGIPRLDIMLGGEGLYAGSSVLISGTAGTGKTSLASYFADATCRRGERCLYFGFEESTSQIIRNMKSIGMDLEQWADQGLLKFQTVRPTLYGLEMHLVSMYKQIQEFHPQLVIVDPISNLTAVGDSNDVKLMITRLLDFLKIKNITSVLLDLNSMGHSEQTGIGISSLIDTWISLRDIELNGERNRGLYILKSRGMAHSNQIREFIFTNHGIDLLDVYTGPEGVLTGSARYAQAEKEKAQNLLRQQEVERKRREIEGKRLKMEAAIAELQGAFEADKEELEKLIVQEELQLKTREKNREYLAQMRKAD